MGFVVTTRKSRGAESQRAVAAYFASNGWPYCTDAGAGRSGADLLNLPGLYCEIRARRELRISEWVRATSKLAGPDLGFVVCRPDGMGPASVADWPVSLRLQDFVGLLARAAP